MEEQKKDNSAKNQEDVSTGPQPVTPHPDLQKSTNQEQNTKQQAATTASKTDSKRKKGGKKWYKHPLFYVALVLIIALLGGGTYAFYEQQIAPKKAMKDYIEAHQDLESFAYSGTLEAEEDGSEGVSGEVKVSGAYDNSDDTELLSMDVDGTYGAGGFNLDVKAESVLEDEILYFNIEQPQMIEFFMPGITGTWYKTELDEVTNEATCEEAELDNALNTLMEKMEEDSPFVNTSRVGWGFETIEGVRTNHYTGEIDNNKLLKALRASEDEIAKDCEDYEKSEYEDDQFEDYEISYDVWLGSDLSRLKIDVVTEDTDFIVDITTSEYNQNVEIDIPSDAKEFNELQGSLQSNQSQFQQSESTNTEFEVNNIPTKTSQSSNQNSGNQAVSLRNLFNF